MKKNDYFYEIEKVYFEKKYDIEKRLKEFKEVWEKGSNKDIHVEVLFMFGFKKNEKPTLIIEAKDLMEIIKSDYDNDMAFTLIEFSYNEKKYVMGSCVLPANAEECKENISFIFQDRVFESFEEFQTAIIIDNKNILQLEKPLEILRAGIIDNEPMLKTPWGDKRLADKAVNK